MKHFIYKCNMFISFNMENQMKLLQKNTLLHLEENKQTNH